VGRLQEGARDRRSAVASAPVGVLPLLRHLAAEFPRRCASAVR
jgi:hypothetical protein